MKKFFFLTIFSLLTITVTAQNIYPEVLEGCDTARFALESKEETAKKPKSLLIGFVTDNLAQEKDQIRGELYLQIIVYKDGSSCLLSVENKTNFSSEELNIAKLKKNIDEELKWENGVENIAALVVLNFQKDKILLKRIGMHGDLGWHELKE